MKKIILIIAGIACLSFAGSAGAAKIYDPGCGSNEPLYGAGAESLQYVNVGGGQKSWEIHWSQLCSQGPYSVEWELQRRLPGQQTWGTVTIQGELQNQLVGTPSGMGGQYVHRSKLTLPAGCVDGYSYREVIYDASHTDPSGGSSSFC